MSIQKSIFPVAGLGTRFLPAIKQMPVEVDKLVVGATPLLLRIDEEGEEKVMNLLLKMAEVLTVRTSVHGPEADRWSRHVRGLAPGERTIVVPAAKASRFAAGKKLAGRKTHQLTLRVSEDYRAYMHALREQVDAESLAQLVRWAVVMLEQALDDGYVIERSDGIMVGDEVVTRPNSASSAQRGGAGDVIRINVGLDADQHARFKRLSKRTGLGLVDMVATALGVLDAWLVAAPAVPAAAATGVEDDDQPAATGQLEESSAM